MTAEERLVEMAQYVRMGGSSSCYSGSQLFQHMLEGSAPGSGGAKFVGVGFAPVLARIAETVRAVSALSEEEQLTVFTCYIEDKPNQAQQAAELGIKPRALQIRLRTIRLKIDDWLLNLGKARSNKFFREPAKIIS